MKQFTKLGKKDILHQSRELSLPMNTGCRKDAGLFAKSVPATGLNRQKKNIPVLKP